MKTGYEPNEIERKWTTLWEKNNIFRSKPSRDRKPYTIVIPPPNVTGSLTLGHVLNNTIQDILVRWKRMQGFETLWLPGTDHAGIATQNVVERELAEQNLTKEQLGRTEFVKRVWEWKEEYGSKIVNQLVRLGCSCDWSRERFTLDEGLSCAVREVFIKLFEKELIYKGEYIINYCPRCRTALSDEEVEHEDIGRYLWYIRYHVKDSDRFIEVATTRPETMLGDTAVAVNPDDKRYRWLIDKAVVLPLLQRELVVIEDSYVSQEFGTGVVKITPAHDVNDFDMANRHNLPKIIVLDENGRMNNNAGPRYAGMDRFACRKKILEDLENEELLIRTEDYHYSIGHCYRCHTVVEPYLSTQWFVRMQKLAEPAINAAVNKRITFFPERWEKVYLHWLTNIRDWCISRQLWWGHRIPVFYCTNCGFYKAYRIQPPKCEKCGSESIYQDEDVLDTWFSSWLWPFSTLGWPEETEDLQYYYPTDALVTAHDIIFFWVARMIMAGLEFRHHVPFHDIVIHGMVRDELGRKMSKSLKNSPDPIAIIEELGADALRMGTVMITPRGGDILFSSNNVVVGRNFANKLWNACRFILMNRGEEGIPDFDPKTMNLTLADKWIISRYNETITIVDRTLSEYRFNEAAIALYTFVWRELCDWYLEFTKPVLYGRMDRGDRKTTISVLVYIMSHTLRLLHPFMPFITEELWEQLDGSECSIQNAHWPQPVEITELDKSEISVVMGVINAIRTVRGEIGIPPSAQVNVVLALSDDLQVAMLDRENGYISVLAKVKSLKYGRQLTPPPMAATAVAGNIEVFVDLAGVVDVDAEIQRLNKDISNVDKELSILDKKLANPNFLEKAPEEIVLENRLRTQQYQEKRAVLRASLDRMRKAKGGRQ